MLFLQATEFLKIVSKPPETAKGMKQTLQRVKRNQPCGYFDLGLPVSITDIINFCSLSYLVCGILLWSLKQVNIPPFWKYILIFSSLLISSSCNHSPTHFCVKYSYLMSSCAMFSRLQLFVTQWTIACQAKCSIYSASFSHLTLPIKVVKRIPMIK